ncbi:MULTISPECIES: excinuclease ABC subunit UvrB [unclassified Fusibacter]|uniref:excinuclease ABC subunit UvrB n=1 Tax=unclassified Fusibacter TaxID=2624464 RepID=UPI00101143F7|nr:MULTISPECIES: excinuclease ABC subunit UvrB [unclassified Fusibacter]MCK8060574.1 excinuclease ABC subunit UvrB [Fusibacter sp. A2]NPE22972.1 excinuclease ABC subunit UvrB [Fusibacter sp. A1]RXV60037.1 excinuclease ABC subunit UvrB [Fusibacter sp. A1]
MDTFKLVSDFAPTGDQPVAIDGLINGFKSGNKKQTLLGVTGSGKTFSVANVIQELKVPTLVIAHNKTLAAQLCSEFREFFPDNAVEYFVSYYDYYQPEAYVAASDTFIEKDSAINEEIDKLRHSATASLFERKDVIIVASVSCIYGLGNPIDYNSMVLSLRPGMIKTRDEILTKLVDIQYVRNDINFTRSTFRVRGDVIEIMPAASFDKAIRIEMFGDEIERIVEVNALTGEILGVRNHAIFFPASHYVTPKDKIEVAIGEIERELEEQIAFFKNEGKLIEAQRIEQRTRYDIEMLREVGFCQGIENYSRVMSLRPPGSRPYTLIDYFPDDFLVVIDESHVSVPQIRGMFGGDQSRKRNLVDYGFRLPSAMDNRPLNFDEFDSLLDKVLYVSATPSVYEKEHSQLIVEQVIRPTGLLDPPVEVRPVEGQIDDLFSEITDRVSKKERVLVTTLTKRMAEDLTDYLKGLDVKVRYMHSDIDTMERMEIIRDLRLGVFDVLVGINLLREGLDLPEVSLVAILDADKEGFLRSETSLVQTIGRAARHLNGRVIMYADKITNSMNLALTETERRRIRQARYNQENGIEPKSIKKNVRAVIEATKASEGDITYDIGHATGHMTIPKDEIETMIRHLTDEMMNASKALEFERAAELRDEINDLKDMLES